MCGGQFTDMCAVILTYYACLVNIVIEKISSGIDGGRVSQAIYGRFSWGKFGAIMLVNQTSR